MFYHTLFIVMHSLNSSPIRPQSNHSNNRVQFESHYWGNESKVKNEHHIRGIILKLNELENLRTNYSPEIPKILFFISNWYYLSGITEAKSFDIPWPAALRGRKWRRKNTERRPRL